MADTAPLEADAVRHVWHVQRCWSTAADCAKRQITRARILGLLLGVTAAILGTAAAESADANPAAGRILAFLAASAAATVPALARRWDPSSIRDWNRMRSISEALKSELYKMLAGVAPYREPEANRSLMTHADQIVAMADDLAGYVPATPHHPPIPAVSNVDTYVSIRLADQIEGYYQPRAQLMAKRIIAVRQIETALAVIAFTLGAIAAAFAAPHAAAWVAAVTTVTAAVAAHAAAARYSYQHIDYSRTAAELNRLREQWHRQQDHTPQSDDTFIEQCENVISAQNEAWMARWVAE